MFFTTYLLRVFCIFLLTTYASLGHALHFGVGNSTLSSGRFVPAANIGFTAGKWTVSGILAGVRTEAYFANLYTVNILQMHDFGSVWLGKLQGGMGVGGGYGVKGVVTDSGELPNDSSDDTILKDTDAILGPAFRVALVHSSNFFLAMEVTLGVGWGTTGNAWSDEGIIAVGVDL